MSKRTKRWLSIVTTLAVAFVMTFGCMGEVFAVENQTDGEQPASVEQTEPEAPAEETAAAEPAEQEEAVEGDVEALGEEPATPKEDVVAFKVVLDGELVQTFYREEAANEMTKIYYYTDFPKNEVTPTYLNNVGSLNGTDLQYSALKNTGTAVNELKGVYGPKLADIFNVCGLTSSDVDYDNATVLFKDMDGKQGASIILSDLFAPRYSFPTVLNYKGKDGDNMGAPVTADEKTGGKPVDAIINYGLTTKKNNIEKTDSADGTPTFGQKTVSDRNKPAFTSGVGIGGSIEISTEYINRWPSVKEASVPNGSEVVPGTIIAFPRIDENDNRTLYYTTDGTKPTIDSTIYNWWNYYGWDYPTGGEKDNPSLSAPNKVVVPDNPGESLTIKIVARGFGKKDSKVSTFNYEIVDKLNLEDATVSTKNKTYTGHAVGTSIVVSLNGETVNASNYELIYKNNVNVGEAKVIVKAKADSTNYKGQISKKFNIIPAKAKITKLTRGSKKLTVYYANQKASGVTSYKIAYKRSGAGWKYTTSKSTYKTIKGLKKGKKYYVRVQAIGSTGYGAWSDIKSIKVK